MHKILLSLSLLVVGFTSAARADTFTFSGVTVSNSVGNGTIVTDAAGTATGGQVTFTGGNTQGTYTFTQTGLFDQTLKIELADLDGHNFLLLLPTSLAGVSTVDVCSNTLTCQGPAKYSSLVVSHGGEYLLSGTLTLQTAPAVVAATPEPSSLILLGTGILGVAGAARRKFLHA